MPPHLYGVFFAMASAVVWGSGDFFGGQATRRSRPFTVAALAALSGLVLLALVTWLRGEPFPKGIDWFWSISAGVAGMVGIAALYRGLSIGSAGVVAPTAAVVGAGVTLLAGIFLEGWPSLLRLAGLVFGLAGIWLVSRPSGEAAPARRDGLGLAVIAGIAFGGFFVLIALVERGLIFSPLVLAKSAALVFALAAALIQREPFPSLRHNPAAWWIALLAGVLDAGGNVLYLLAHQFTRLDIAAILSSMYPGSTVLLSALLLKERLGRGQQMGLVLCLLALGLIAA